MLKKISLLLLAIIINVIAFSQSENLVLNPSFEQFDKCPEGYTHQDKSHKLIPHWTYPTLTTPDYFNRCSKSIVQVPSNFAGKANPQSGDGYMGSILSGTEMNYREYFQGELKKPLKEGEKYCITFYYRLASYSKFAVDQMSLYFTESKTENESKTYLKRKPQLNNKEGLFLDNINKWKQMCWVYKAKGGEQFFIVGNFNPYKKTNYVVTDKNVTNKRNKAYAYYYFDDFAIRSLTNCDICPCVQHGLESAITESSYTGGVDPVTNEALKIINDGKISVKVFGGNKPYKILWSTGATFYTLENLPAGEYSYTVTDQNNCISTGKVIFKEPVLRKDPFEEGLQNIKEGETLVLNNIFFETGKNTLLEQSSLELDKVVDFLNKNSIEKIEIAGYTDSKGSDITNQKLSEGRAKAVVDYLTEKGIDANSLIAVGYGEQKPIDTNFTKEGQSKNRRVEFKILKK